MFTGNLQPGQKLKEDAHEKDGWSGANAGRSDSNEGKGVDTYEVVGVEVEGKSVRVLSGELMSKLLAEDVKLSDLAARLRGKIPEGYRLPTRAEITKLKTEKQEQFQRLREASGVAGVGFSVLTDDGTGIERSSEWGADGKEVNKDVNSENKKELKLQPNDFIFLVKAESLQSSNK